MSDAPNLQHLVYDVAVAATECNPTQAHSAREAVIKCHCMEAPLCGERTSSRSLAPSHRVTLSCHCCRTELYKDGTTSVRIMKLTDLIS